MYRRNNRYRPDRQGRRPFGWLPIIVAVIALVAIFGGRDRGEFRGRSGPWQAPPRAEQFERSERPWAEERSEYRSDGHYEWQQRRHMPFVAPFFFVGKLLKLLLAIGLIGAGLYVLRRDRRPRWRGPDGPNDGPGTPVGPVFRA